MTFRRTTRPAPLLAPLALLSALTLLAGGCQTGPVPAAEFVTQADRLHREALAGTVNPDRNLTAYFDEMGQRLVKGAQAASGEKFKDPVFANIQFHLVGTSDVPNAFTTGGRHVYITNAAFQLCRGEEDLAALMAHEFAHAVDLDVQRSGIKPDPRDSLDRAVFAFATNPTSPGFEQEADAKAFSFYVRAGWDPARFGGIFESLSASDAGRQPAGGGRGTTGVPGTPLAARVSAARGLARDLGAGAPNRLVPIAEPGIFAELRAAANAFTERSTPSSDSWLYVRAFPNCLLPNDLPAQRDAQQELRRRTAPPVQSTPKEPN